MNAGFGAAANVLFVNGSARGAERSVHVRVGEPLEARMDRAPAGPEPAGYALWLWSGRASSSTELNVAGSRVGCTVDQTPFVPGASPQPFQCRHGGLGPQFCSGLSHVFTFQPSAPWAITRPFGLPMPLVFTMQGVIQDAGSTRPSRLSVTNAVIVRVH